MRDDVDELAEAWARERPDLDLAPVAVFSRITRLARGTSTWPAAAPSPRTPIESVGVRRARRAAADRVRRTSSPPAACSARPW